jgi:hypothetical protein
MLFQDEEEKEKEVPLVRKRKQPSASISQPSEGGPSIDEAKEDKAEPALKKNEETRKKKKNEEPRPKANVREKSAAKGLKCTRHLKSPVIVVKNQILTMMQQRETWTKRTKLSKLQKKKLLDLRMILRHTQKL